MATVNATSSAQGIYNFSAGSFTSDNTVTVVNLGFVPRRVRVINNTDAIVWEKTEGMAVANTLRTGPVATTPASSQVTVDTSSALTIGTDGTFTLTAAAVGSAKAITWTAEA